MWSGKAVSSNTGLKLCKRGGLLWPILEGYQIMSTSLQDRVVQRWAKTEPGLERDLNSDIKAKKEIILFDSFRLEFDDWIR